MHSVEVVLIERWVRLKMEEPNLDRMWEAFMRIGLPESVSLEIVYEQIRTKLRPLFAELQNEEVIEWYSFLIHNREHGVPTTEDDRNFYFHIRFGLREGVDEKRLEKSLSAKDFLKMRRRKIRPTRPTKIQGIDESLMRNQRIEPAWRVLGEQAEWFVNMLGSHMDDINIPKAQVEQFLHFYSNMSGLSKWRKILGKCPNCGDLVVQKDLFFSYEH